MLSPNAIRCLRDSCVVFAESSKSTHKLFARSGIHKPREQIFFLDNANRSTLSKANELINNIARQSLSASLLSDCGMPILFDPGKEILQMCQARSFIIRTIPAATSWGTACAVSGFDPPFHLIGFVPQKGPERRNVLSSFVPLRAHLVLLDAPYRFGALLRDVISVFGPQQDGFMAWEIGSPMEHYEWGTMDSILRRSLSARRNKGRFVLVLNAN